MGTNYYAKSETCECCGHTPEQIHIGKYSRGWTFCFHAPNSDLNSKSKWEEFLKDKTIVDEYGEEVDYVGFFSMVAKKQSEPRNHALEFPEGNFIDAEGYTFSTHEFS
jgi:hypothetical protein